MFRDAELDLAFINIVIHLSVLQYPNHHQSFIK